jgi:acid phosphatase (class A)
LIRLRPFLTLLVLLCSIGFPANAPESASYCVSSSDLPPVLLPLPYTEDSAEWKKDIQTVIAVQQHISANDLAALRDEQRMRVELVTSVLGPDFTREKKPATFALLDHVTNDVTTISEADKKYWHIKRPYLEDPHVKLLVDPIDSSPAYPSGHTAESRVLAEVLGMLYPGKLATLRARADQIAWHRVEAGVHYPHDLDGGRLLAMLITGAMVKCDAFQTDLAAARKEAGS